MKMNAIQINNVTKRYRDVTALDHISCSFEHGKIYGFLGRNGAGKSTLINIIANRIFADEGTVFIATHLIEEVANIIEEVVLIDRGKLLLQESVDSLLERGYCISGLAEEVDSYCKDKNVIGNDELGGLKLSYVIGEKTELPQGSHLQITGMNLQKLFIKLTEKGGEER